MYFHCDISYQSHTFEYLVSAPSSSSTLTGVRFLDTSGLGFQGEAFGPHTSPSPPSPPSPSSLGNPVELGLVLLSPVQMSPFRLIPVSHLGPSRHKLFQLHPTRSIHQICPLLRRPLQLRPDSCPTRSFRPPLPTQLLFQIV
ncbi:hypothetical protein CRG98_003405 [Punica granatum]|uniref:Uncharacterized protein n=1 Tax=Punica granatum TaxID=22663 RepID=A0A2I0L652_PUNGR|nr:hypothetical protein CRG98_003405 [Punica granatum]